MTGQPDDLVARVRAALPRDGAVRDVSMFGGRALMLDNRMVVSVHADGSLLVRVDPARSAELLSVAGARPAVMGADRSMGPGWISVGADGLAAGQQLAFWIEVALQHHASAGAGARRGKG
ncbi:MAG TPA: TfoX/Sxy family protein [Mycobacteriales bacterium]|nr:TfoX/Sxy family protein [Mycobacteriales bacterium]